MYDLSKLKIGKNPCIFKDCDSSDGLHYYGEGQGAHCYVCLKSVLSDDMKEELGIEEENEQEEVVTREKITPEENEKIKSRTSTDGKGYRGIKTATNNFFGVRY